MTLEMAIEKLNKINQNMVGYNEIPYVYIAIDKSMDIFAYIDKPTINEIKGVWWGRGNGTTFDVKYLGICSDLVDWETSLMTISEFEDIKHVNEYGVLAHIFKNNLTPHVNLI